MFMCYSPIPHFLLFVPNLELDCTGLKCPMPIVRLSRAMKEIEVGDTVTVHADDAAFPVDIESFVRMTGQRLETLTGPAPRHTAVILRLK
jgi:tRNA 2-thiouridine synthesizing protein A